MGLKQLFSQRYREWSGQHRRILSESAEIGGVDVSDRVSEKLAEIGELIKKYFNDDLHLAVWQLDRGTEELQKHIASMEIPFIRGNAFPSLLLHAIGDPYYDSCISRNFALQSSALK